MADSAQKPNRRHVELAQKILELAIERGMAPGERLAEQALANLCNVSRTPVRKALQLLADKGMVVADTEGGYRFAADPVMAARLDSEFSGSDEDDLHGAILRDLAAGRLADSQTVAALQRRYEATRQTVQNALMKLSEDNLAERGAGQQWTLKQFAIGADAAAKSFEFRLASEPLALTMPDFKRDATAIMSLRQSMLMLKGMDEISFDRRLFERTDMDFHLLIARCCGNPFMAETLTSHHRRRFALPQTAHVGTFRLMQSNDEHLLILQQIERGQMALAADLMRVHLQLSQTQRPKLAGRGVPAAIKRLSR
ncbi:GntR family transcriptional regulator [Agrobacterium sp. ES01]|uniref:GntR family transcriptional regulator n=1 Tax=Agrobacterium sp. ES01 TaxID=3420714 RepID=UPI003D14DB5C